MKSVFHIDDIRNPGGSIAYKVSGMLFGRQVREQFKTRELALTRKYQLELEAAKENRLSMTPPIPAMPAPRANTRIRFRLARMPAAMAAVGGLAVLRAIRVSQLFDLAGAMALEGIIGVSDAMRTVCHAVEKVAPTGSRVLIQGPAGSGKEVVSRMIHARSRRSDGPFVALNCAILNPARFEEELFGVEAGADPVAQPRRAGVLELHWRNEWDTPD